MRAHLGSSATGESVEPLLVSGSSVGDRWPKVRAPAILPMTLRGCRRDRTAAGVAADAAPRASTAGGAARALQGTVGQRRAPHACLQGAPAPLRGTGLDPDGEPGRGRHVAALRFIAALRHGADRVPVCGWLTWCWPTCQPRGWQATVRWTPLGRGCTDVPGSKLSGVSAGTEPSDGELWSSAPVQGPSAVIGDTGLMLCRAAVDASRAAERVALGSRLLGPELRWSLQRGLRGWRERAGRRQADKRGRLAALTAATIGQKPQPATGGCWAPHACPRVAGAGPTACGTASRRAPHAARPRAAGLAASTLVPVECRASHGGSCVCSAAAASAEPAGSSASSAPEGDRDDSASPASDVPTGSPEK